jgi:TonB family protein
MIVAWLTYCVLVATLLGAAAWVAERAARAQGWSGRWPWALALGGSLALPLAAWLRPASPAEMAAPSGVPMPGAYLMESLPPLMLQPVGTAAPSLETVLLWAWAAASGVLLLYLVVSGLRVRAAGRRWRRGEVDGVEVMVSESTGPAALGLFRGRVVLPEWALSLDERLRRLLVLHEAEHVRAKDPQLAVAGLVACALMPWNVALWWQLARLRLAIEVDCDARVLRRSDDAAGYGTLLLEVGQRRSRLALGLAESRSMLERRIRMITRRELGRRTVRALGLGAVAGVVLAVACETSPPTGLADVASRPLAPEQSLGEARALTGEPTIVVDTRVMPGRGLDSLRPDDVARVDIFRNRGESRPDVVVIETRDASPEIQEEMRRIREALVAERDGRVPESQPDLTHGGDGPVFTPMTVRPQLTNAAVVRQALQDHYPPLLRDAGITGTASVWMFIDAEGVVQQVRLHESAGHEALDAAALRVARLMEFSPAYNRDVRVPVWVALPITFETARPGGERDAVRDRFEEHNAQLAERVRREQERLAQAERQAEAREDARVDPEAGPVFTPMTVRPQLQSAREVQEALRRHYPPLLRDAGIGGTVNVWFFIDEQGTVRGTRLAETSGYDALDQAALRVAAAMRFTPARNRDQPVPVWVSLPITFEIQ